MTSGIVTAVLLVIGGVVSLVGIPIAWGFRRISHGRRRVQYVVVVLTLLLTATLSIVATMLWLQLGVLQPLTVPT